MALTLQALLILLSLKNLVILTTDTNYTRNHVITYTNSFEHGLLSLVDGDETIEEGAKQWLEHTSYQEHGWYILYVKN